MRPSGFGTADAADPQGYPAAVCLYGTDVGTVKREAAMTAAAAYKPVELDSIEERIIGALRKCIDFFFFNRYHGFCNHQWRIIRGWCVGWGQKPTFGRRGFCSFLWVQSP